MIAVEVKTLRERAAALRYTYITCLVVCMEGVYVHAIFYAILSNILFVKRNGTRLNAGGRSIFYTCDLT